MLSDSRLGNIITDSLGSRGLVASTMLLQAIREIAYRVYQGEAEAELRITMICQFCKADIGNSSHKSWCPVLMSPFADWRVYGNEMHEAVFAHKCGAIEIPNNDNLSNMLQQLSGHKCPCGERRKVADEAK